MRFAPGLVSLVAAAALASACASPTQQTWTPTVDTYNNSRAQFLTQDSAESFASRAEAALAEAKSQARGSVVVAGQPSRPPKRNGTLHELAPTPGEIVLEG